MPTSDSDFNIAYALMRDFEGGYVNDPDDPGGETYAGITRRNHPLWDGWERIDELKRDRVPQRDWEHAVGHMVKTFYHDRYWRKQKLHELPVEIALEMFESSVNVGPHRVGVWLQRALNALNRRATLFPDLTEDGVIGPLTLGAVAVIEREDDLQDVEKLLNLQQGKHYFNLCRKNDKFEKYLRGWLTRIHL